MNPTIFDNEKQGQIEFFKQFHIDYENNPVLIENSDGVWNGNLMEFKPYIKDVNAALFQAIKYLSKMRIHGKNVPSTILLISLNNKKCYVFKSSDYRQAIETVYVGASSKDNKGFICNSADYELDYSISTDTIKLKKILKNKEFMPITINEDCIVGWAERYYSENPNASKGDFLGDYEGQVKIIGEIREPKIFKGLILPYTGKTNEKFKYLMDKLNDRIKKKTLGAYYTPIEYTEMAVNLIMKAIERVPEGNDYIILDRCAGTGNLEAALVGMRDKNGSEIIEHCILSTYEYYEYKVLQERLGDKVLFIVPPTEEQVEYSNGLILNADAMSEDFINHPDIKAYIDNPKYTIILLENPPYRDDTSGMTGVKSEGLKRESYVLSEMNKAGIGKTNELANRFIWSGFNYYLRQSTDSFILFAPIKYWKVDKLINKRFIDGYVFNKKHFHASSSAIACILWGNEDFEIDELLLDAYDINKNNVVEKVSQVKVRRVYNEITKLFDKRKCTDDIQTTYCCNTNGSLSIAKKEIGRLSDNIIGYFVGRGFGISNPNLNFNLVRLTFSDLHGFHLRKDTYIKYLPILSVKHYLMFERPWYETELICCSSDKEQDYMNDIEFLNHCFFFACLNYYNKCKTLTLPDGTIIQNELCFVEGTIAYNDLLKISLNDDAKAILKIWTKIQLEAKKCDGYNDNWNYGVYQIAVDLNTSYKDSKNNIIYNYPTLNGDLNSLTEMLHNYFKKYIRESLFKYELIK